MTSKTVKRRAKKIKPAINEAEQLLAQAPPELIASVQRILKQNEESCSILFIEDMLSQPCIAVYTTDLDATSLGAS